MFWRNFVELCVEKGKSPNGVCAELGFSANTATKWKQGAVPRDTTLKVIADHFGVTVDELLAEDTPAPLPFAVVAPMSISEQERALLLAFRSASAERRESVLLLLGLPAERKESEA